MSEDFIDLCEKYLESLDEDIAEEEIERLEERGTELEEEREKYIEEYGEDDVLVERVDDELEELNSKLDSKKQEFNRAEELGREVLERTASEFIAEGKFLDEACLEAINHTLTENREPALLIGDQKVTSDTELEDGVRRVSHVIRKLVLAKLGQDGDIKESWQSIEKGKRHEPFLVVARANEPLSSSQITERIDEDVSSGTVGGRLRDSINKLEYSPYHRVEGNYLLSTIGEVMVQEYEASIQRDASEEESESIEESAEELDNDQQITLDSTPKKND